jgi:hypothetical protein
MHFTQINIYNPQGLLGPCMPTSRFSFSSHGKLILDISTFDLCNIVQVCTYHIDQEITVHIALTSLSSLYFTFSYTQDILLWGSSDHKKISIFSPLDYKKVVFVSTFWNTMPCSPVKVNWSFEKHAGFLINLFFDPEDGGDIFLHNISWLSMDYMVLYISQKTELFRITHHHQEKNCHLLALVTIFYPFWYNSSILKKGFLCNAKLHNVSYYTCITFSPQVSISSNTNMDDKQHDLCEFLSRS